MKRLKVSFTFEGPSEEIMDLEHFLTQGFGLILEENIYPKIDITETDSRVEDLQIIVGGRMHVQLLDGVGTCGRKMIRPQFDGRWGPPDPENKKEKEMRGSGTAFNLLNQIRETAHCLVSFSRPSDENLFMRCNGCAEHDGLCLQVRDIVRRKMERRIKWQTWIGPQIQNGNAGHVDIKVLLGSSPTGSALAISVEHFIPCLITREIFE